jgi:hypothetical protein
LGETLKKLFVPTLEKALTFLDDKLLPSTSNAVERGNRRYRKMQKQVYRARTQAQISARLCWTCGEKPKGQGATKPSTPYMRHVLPEVKQPDIFATVSKNQRFYCFENRRLWTYASSISHF